MTGRRIVVTIDRVALRGVDPHHAPALAASLQAELARVLAEPQVQAAARATRSAQTLRLGRMPLEPGRSGATRFGASVARAIGKGIKR